MNLMNERVLLSFGGGGKRTNVDFVVHPYILTSLCGEMKRAEFRRKVVVSCMCVCACVGENECIWISCSI